MAGAISPINDHLSAQIPRLEARIDGSITACERVNVRADGNAYQHCDAGAEDSSVAAYQL